MGSPPRTRYAIVGTGLRAQMYVDAVSADHADVAELVAVLDTNAVRARYTADRLAGRGIAVEMLDPADLADVVHSRRIDRVIVTTPDRYHAEYIGTALRAGADVVVEKPLAIDADGVRGVAAAVAETGREVVVAFNYRYAPRNCALREVVASGRIGQVSAVHFEWLLDTAHGADYFRRWHRQKENSGGLLVHKASHHFDLVNWWIGGTPVSVFARGGLRFYGARNAERRGWGPRPDRGTHDGPTDPFQLDLRHDPRLRSLYLAAEGEDGYLRDRDVFSEGISIEDTLSLLVEYDGGATMTYSLTAYSPWEGYRVSVTGTQGRAELEVVERAAVLVEGGPVIDPSLTVDEPGSRRVRRRSERLVVQEIWSEAEEVAIPDGVGGHGGGDALLLADVFRGPRPDDLGRSASWVDGVRSAAVGIAGNASLAQGMPVRIAQLDLGVDLSRPGPGRRP